MVVIRLLTVLLSCALGFFVEASDRLPVSKKNSDDGAFRYAFFGMSDDRQWMTLSELEKTTEPENGHGTHFGMIEISAFSDVPQTDAQKKAAKKIHEQVVQAALKHGWFSYKKALADGYAVTNNLDTVHLSNKKFLLDDDVLNPDKPEFLMFYNTAKGQLLAGVMFLVRKHHDHGFQIGGNETIWHFHLQPDSCWENMLPAGNAINGKCSKGKIDSKSPEMLHVWIADHPKGAFATDMLIAEDELIKNKQIVSHADKK